MRKSKLELYEEIIYALAKNALTIDSIAFRCNTSCVTLQRRLEFLMAHNLVEIAIGQDNRVLYVLTQRGVAISKTLAITKRLEKLQTH
jgi:predicted transcriptional regulator